MDRDGEAGALANALDQAVHGVGCEGPTPLGGKYKAAIGKLPAQFVQSADFVAAERIHGWLAVLNPAHMQRGRSAELDFASIPGHRFPRLAAHAGMPPGSEWHPVGRSGPSAPP